MDKYIARLKIEFLLKRRIILATVLVLGVFIYNIIPDLGAFLIGANLGAWGLLEATYKKFVGKLVRVRDFEEHNGVIIIEWEGNKIEIDRSREKFHWLNDEKSVFWFTTGLILCKRKELETSSPDGSRI